MSVQATMKAAVLNSYGVPEYGEFPVPPHRSEDAVLIHVEAATINGVDRAIASGGHFLSPARLPVVAGRDGVGRTDDGRLVYFDGPVDPYGSMAEQSLAPHSTLIELPANADVPAAAVLGNAGLAAWLPLSWRADLQPGETVAVLGAAGAVGSLAVQAARHLGAGHVVGVVHGHAEAAHAKRLGADVVVDTAEVHDLAAALGDAAPRGFDVIADYLWGTVGAAALDNAAMGARHVQIGTVVSDDLVVSGEKLRSKAVNIMGYVSFHAPLATRVDTYLRMVSLAAEGKLEVAVETFQLSDVATAWTARPTVPASRPVLLT